MACVDTAGHGALFFASTPRRFFIRLSSVVVAKKVLCGFVKKVSVVFRFDPVQERTDQCFLHFCMIQHFFDGVTFFEKERNEKRLNVASSTPCLRRAASLPQLRYIHRTG